MFVCVCVCVCVRERVCERDQGVGTIKWEKGSDYVNRNIRQISLFLL